MNRMILILMLSISAPAGAQDVGDPVLLAKQQRNAAVAAGLVKQEPLYQEDVLAGARIKNEREAAARRSALNRSLLESNYAVERAEANLRDVETRAEIHQRAQEMRMMVRQTHALEAMAHRRR